MYIEDYVKSGCPGFNNNSIESEETCTDFIKFNNSFVIVSTLVTYQQSVFSFTCTWSHSEYPLDSVGRNNSQ
jgi:hypothetical protein